MNRRFDVADLIRRVQHLREQCTCFRCGIRVDTPIPVPTSPGETRGAVMHWHYAARLGGNVFSVLCASHDPRRQWCECQRCTVKNHDVPGNFEPIDLGSAVRKP